MENMNEMHKAKAGKYNMLLLIIGWISAILSLIAYPFIFGVIGVIMGIIVTKSGSRAGLPLIVTSIVLMGIGLIFWRTFLNYITQIF